MASPFPFATVSAPTAPISVPKSAVARERHRPTVMPASRPLTRPSTTTKATANRKDRKFLKVMRTVTVATAAARGLTPEVPSIAPLSLSPTWGICPLPAT